MRSSTQTLVLALACTSLLSGCIEAGLVLVHGTPNDSASAPYEMGTFYELSFSSTDVNVPMGYTVRTDVAAGARETFNVEISYPSNTVGFNGFDVWGDGAYIGGFAIDFDASSPGVPERIFPAYAIDVDDAYIDTNLNGTQEDFEPTVRYMLGPAQTRVIQVNLPYGGDGNQVRTTAQFPFEMRLGLRAGIFNTPSTMQMVPLTTIHTSIDPDTGHSNDNAGIDPTVINDTEMFEFAPATFFSSVLPSSRTGQFEQPTTVFASAANGGTGILRNCGYRMDSIVRVRLDYQTTDPATNTPTGTINTPVDIAPGATQSFVLTLRPSQEVFNGTPIPFIPQPVEIPIVCDGPAQAGTVVGVNTLQYNAGADLADVVALSAVTTNDGILAIPGPMGSAAFGVATFNLGAEKMVTVRPRASYGTAPLALSICETTGQAGGACINPPAAEITINMPTNSQHTFSTFGTVSGEIEFRPANHRIFIDYEADGSIVGGTSVAVRTVSNP